MLAPFADRRESALIAGSTVRLSRLVRGAENPQSHSSWSINSSRSVCSLVGSRAGRYCLRAMSSDRGRAGLPIGRSSATGFPFRVTIRCSPCVTRREAPGRISLDQGVITRYWLPHTGGGKPAGSNVGNRCSAFERSGGMPRGLGRSKSAQVALMQARARLSRLPAPLATVGHATLSFGNREA